MAFALGVCFLGHHGEKSTSSRDAQKMKTKAVSWILGPPAYGFAKDRLFWVSGGMRNPPRAEMPKNETSKSTERPKTKISKYQNINVSKVSKYRREWGPGRGASEGGRSGLQESRRGDSPTGAGGTPGSPLKLLKLCSWSSRLEVDP